MTVSLARRSLVAALAAAAAAPSAVLAQPQRRPWPAGQPTPPLDLPTLDGRRWRLADARGQVVVVNFWASWCQPCRAELPSLELLGQRHERDGLQVVTVNFRETDAALRRFLDQVPMELPILRDVDGAAARAWGARVFPTTAVVGRDGRVAFTVVGELDWMGADVRRWLQPLL